MNVMYVYSCVRAPGYVYEFMACKNKLFRCSACHRLGRKSRYVTIENDTLVPSGKHPEDDHICEPLSAEGMQAYVCD